jgi:hypothetical protein
MVEAEAGSTVLVGVVSEVGPVACRTHIGPSERPTAIARSGRGGLSPEGWSIHNGLRVSGIREEMSTGRWVPMSELRKSVADARRQGAQSSAWLNATPRPETHEWS